MGRATALPEQLERRRSAEVHTQTGPGRATPYRCSGLERRERRPHRLLDDLLHEELVAEARLELRRVHIHVHRVAREMEEEQE